MRFVPVKERDAVVCIDSEGRVLEWNGGAELLLGWRREEALGRELASLIIALPQRIGFSEAWRDFTGSAGGGSSCAALSVAGIRKNSSPLRLEITATRILESGTWKNTLSIRKGADPDGLEARFRTLEEQLHIILEASPFRISYVGNDLRYRFVSESAAGWVGLNPKDMVGKRVDEVLGKGAFNQVRPKLEPVFAGKTVVLEEEIPNPQGGLSYFRLYYVPHFRKDGRLEGIMTFMLDLTDLRKTEENLRQAQKMEAVGRLAGGIAHDFNNLLTAINGFAEMALHSLDNPEAAQGMLEQIRLSGDRAADLTRQLLAFSRKQILVPKLIDLNAVLSGMKPMLLRLVRADIQLSFLFAPELDPIRMDPGQLEQIVLNLVINGCDAMPEGGRLVLETFKAAPKEHPGDPHDTAGSHGYVILQVSDTGMGMASEIQARIFEPYFTTKEPGKGTGMGLATVFGILNQSGGAIQVASEPEKGSRFKVFFPIGEGKAETDAQRSARPLSTNPSGQVVLIVEDEEPVRTFAKQVLESYGFRIVLARSGKEALERLAQVQGPVHMLLTDLVMPGMNGPELWKAVKSSHPETEVLFMSGYMDSEGIPKDLLSAGAPFLQKPFSVQQLVEKVKERLNRSDSGN
jgi:PAS domain S-box-containing protein